jgi:arylsulfatase A-like enzyme
LKNVLLEWRRRTRDPFLDPANVYRLKSEVDATFKNGRYEKPAGWEYPEYLAPATVGAVRPNVLFISIDDMNDWVGALGYETARTPHIDRLSARGTLFTNAHAASPKCNPSRTAILSGLRPSTTGIYGNGEWWKPNLPDVVMLPRYFKDNGYYAAGGGKVFHHTPGFNPPESWDEYFDLVDDLKTDGFLIPYRQPDHISSFDWGPLDKSDMEMGDGATVRWAEEFLSRRHERPFFLAVGLFQPHLPFYAPRERYDAVGPGEAPVPKAKPDDLDDVPEPGRKLAASRLRDLQLIIEHGDLANIVRAYTACIRHADALVGRVLDALDSSPYGSNTIVVFWSDHGYHFGEKQHFAKDTLWERSSHVPLAVVAPGVTDANTVCNRPVSLLDLYPTLVDLCGLPRKKDLEGVSLRPLLEDPARNWERPAVMTFGRGNHAVRSERYRYIRYANGEEELYDHERDPEEWTNLASDEAHADVIARHARWLPNRNAPGALRKNAFEFNPQSYTWKPKAASRQQ